MNKFYNSTVIEFSPNTYDPSPHQQNEIYIINSYKNKSGISGAQHLYFFIFYFIGYRLILLNFYDMHEIFYACYYTLT